MAFKVLVVCSQEIMLENNDGGKKCSYRNYMLYKKVFGEENVFLCMFSNNTSSQNTKHIFRYPSHKNLLSKMLNVLRGNLFSSSETENKLIDYIEQNKIDIVIFERSIWGSAIEKIKKGKTPCQVWIFVHNCEKKYFANKIKYQNFHFILPFFSVIRSEKKSIRKADYIITLTERDSRLLGSIYNRSSDFILPMTFEDKFNSSTHFQEYDKTQLLFIGSLFPPNVNGIKWFIEEVMSALPEYSLLIVGKDFEKERNNLERENVTVVGSVDCLEPYYYSNSIMVMPIFFGDGMKIKTAEAMMYGKIILATDEALEGYEVNGVKDIYRCNTKEEFINTISRITVADTYSKEVRNLFLEKYCTDKYLKKCYESWI